MTLKSNPAVKPLCQENLDSELLAETPPGQTLEILEAWGLGFL